MTIVKGGGGGGGAGLLFSNSETIAILVKVLLNLPQEEQSMITFW